MPLYDIRCDRTGEIFERVISLANFEAPIFCDCQSLARRVISTPMIAVDHTGYNCPVTGKWVGSKREHRENLAQNGCRVLEAGETQSSTQRRQADEDALLDRVGDTVEKTIDSWSSDKKEKLHNELINGKADLSVDRL